MMVRQNETIFEKYNEILEDVITSAMNADVSGLCPKNPQGTSPLTRLLGSAQTRPCRKRGKGKTLFRRIRMF